jgi:hypothetical protein
VIGAKFIFEEEALRYRRAVAARETCELVNKEGEMPVDDNAEKPKPGNSALNRRDLLLGGTTITAASAMASTGRAAEGSPENSYYPNDNLAEAIVRAWSDTKYRDDLLTDITKGEKDYKKTADALAKVSIFIDKPVVVDVKDANYKAQDGEIVFVLPKMPGTIATLATARVAMALQARGI